MYQMRKKWTFKNLEMPGASQLGIYSLIISLSIPINFCLPNSRLIRMINQITWCKSYFLSNFWAASVSLAPWAPGCNCHKTCPTIISNFPVWYEPIYAEHRSWTSPLIPYVSWWVLLYISSWTSQESGIYITLSR